MSVSASDRDTATVVMLVPVRVDRTTLAEDSLRAAVATVVAAISGAVVATGVEIGVAQASVFPGDCAALARALEALCSRS